MVHLASSSNGFACGLSIVDDSKTWSAYHDKDTLFTFTIEGYQKGVDDYPSFNSQVGARVIPEK